MHKEIADMWVAALRSDEYGQTYGHLREEYEEGQFAYCALGVLCDVHAKSTGKPFPDDNGVIPADVQVWAGLRYRDPDLAMQLEDDDPEEPTHMLLTEANDEYGWCFRRLADAIEQQWERL
jgi:hypothetical protein